ncbi:11088_t:CDS:1, partial [Entrophospora sp. SA101]
PNLMSKSSATTNRKFDPCLLGSKPDFTVMTSQINTLSYS